MRSVLAKSPYERGYRRSRWILRVLLEELNWNVESVSGLHQVLGRLGISWTRGRQFVQSPDPHFDAKKEYVEEQVEKGKDDETTRIFYLDELTYYPNCPQSGGSWSKRGKQPTVERRAAAKYANSRNILGAVDAESGRLFFRHGDGTTRYTLVELYEELYRSYPNAERFIVVQDNLAVHFHTYVLRQLEPQNYPWPFLRPSNWPDPSPARKSDGPLPVQLVPLPTYASWLNPIERLWRHLRRVVLTMHREANGHVSVLMERVEQFLTRFTTPSRRLLELLSITGG